MRKSAANAKEKRVKSDNRWLASNPSKRWGEAFFLLYTPFWLTLCLGIVVPFKLYEVNDVPPVMSLSTEKNYQVRPKGVWIKN